MVSDVSRAIERGPAMRTEGEIKSLREMPADSIVAATTTKELGTYRWQLCGKATSLSQEYVRGPWQVVARMRPAGRADQCPQLGVERTQRRCRLWAVCPILL